MSCENLVNTQTDIAFDQLYY